MTACIDRDGNRVEPEGVCPVYDTGSPWPTFSLVKPAINNTRVDMSPRQSVFAVAVDAIQAVDLCYDAMMSEIDNGKMRVLLLDVMFDVERDGKGGRVSIPFGKGDCTVFRKVMSTADTIHEFAPTLRTEAQGGAADAGRPLRVWHQLLRPRERGYVKTATEVSADNSALMRNIRRHEHALEGAMAGICRALLAVERTLGVELPDEGGIRVTFDDSIITDTTAEKRQDMDEVAAGLMQGWEYRAKWYGEDEATARRRGAAAGSAATRRTRPGSPDRTDGIASGREGPDAAAGDFGAVTGSGSLGDPKRRPRVCDDRAGARGGEVAAELRSLPLGEDTRTSTPHHHPGTGTKEQQPICRSGVRAAARNRPGLRTSTSQQAMPRAAAVYAKRREGQTA